MIKTKPNLTGLISAPFTPMDKNGAVNLMIIDDYVDYLTENNVNGAFICGTTGESASLTTEERMAIAERWVGATKGRIKIIVHVGGTSLPQSKALASHAQKIGADCIAAMAPYFFKPASVSLLINYMQPVAASAPKLPFYYYNMPSITGVDLPVDQFLMMADKRIPNLAGVKYTHTNLKEMQLCLNTCNKKFEILNGFDEILITGLAIGAKAAVGSTYNYMPFVYLNIMKAMEEGDMERARYYQMLAINAMEVIFKYGGGVRAGKAAMSLTGVDCGPCRLPLEPFGNEEYDMLKKELESIGFFGVPYRQ
ncbi:MAG: dihydrodipicolinate synthase family protein [Bacteroidales bacterium]|nr:dihydrodipicolinate synthase family protein [Bacteroidales bacterium]